MLRIFTISLVSLAYFLAGSGTPARADGATFSGTIDTGDTAFSNCDGLYAEVIEFNVSETGDYTLDSASPEYTDSANNQFSITLYIEFPDNLNSSLPNRDDTRGIINNTDRHSDTFTLRAGTRYYFAATGVGDCTFYTSYPVPYSFRIKRPGEIRTAEDSSSAQARSQPPFRDGRINNYDMANPVVVYPVPDDKGRVALHIYSDTGNLLLVVIPSEIESAPDSPEGNVIITQNTSRNVNFTRVPATRGGIWQVTAPMYNGKIYVLQFTEFYPNTGYTSYEIK